MNYAAIALLSAFALPAAAQLSRGYISGSVEDPTGAAAKNVQVAVTNGATGNVHRATSNDAGIYRIAAVEPGVYSLQFSKAGFRDARIEAIEVGPAHEVRVNHKLTLADAASSILVESTPAGVNLSKASATIERTLGRDSLESLPLTGFRDTTNLLALAPGAIRIRPLLELNYSAAGQRGESMMFLADGADNEHHANGFPNWRPIPEGVSEIQAQTNAYAAEFGRGAGAVFSVISRAGTNQLHGSLWDYYGANWLAARSLADKQAGLSVARFQQHQAGVNLGGPVVRNKTFFFALVQAAPERLGVNARTAPAITIPTPSGYAALPRVPLAPGQTRENREAILGTLAFLPQVYPHISRFENVRPLPVNGALVEVGTARVPEPNAILILTSQGRLDHRFSDRDSATVRFRREDGDGDMAFRGAASISNTSFGRLFASGFTYNNNNLLASHTRAINQATISEFRFSYLWIRASHPPLGEPGPAVNIGGFAFGPNIVIPRRTQSDQLEWQEVVTAQLGRHSLKAGVDVSRHLQSVHQSTLTRGSWTFAGLGELLNSQALLFVQWLNPTDVKFAQTQQSYFFQDDIRLTRNLTLNLGMRYQTAGQPLAKFSAASPELLRAGAMPPAHRDTNDWAPRFGFAWSPMVDVATVIRGGYGVAHVQFYGADAGTIAGNYPLNSSNLKIFPETANLYPAIPARPPSLPPLNARTESFTDLLPETQNPTTHFYSLSVQREFGGYFLEAGYLGNRSYHLLRMGQRNPAVLTPQQAQVVVASGNAGLIPPVQSRRLNPDWNARTSIEYAATSNYNAAFLRFDRKMSRDLLVGVNYTFSATLDDGDGFAHDAFNFRREYARAAIDRPHRLALHYVWTLPRAFQVAGFSEWQSGEPFTVTTGVDSNGDGTVFDRPDYNPSGALQLDPATGDWRTFATPLNGVGIFRTPLARMGTPLQFSMPSGGNLGRNTFRGPGYASTNFSVLKTFVLSERSRLEIRASWTNFLNQRNFGPPVAVMSNPQFGANVSNPESRSTLLGVKIRF